MAKRKNQIKGQPKKRAKLRRKSSAVRGKARKVSKSARGKATKRTVAGAKKAMRKKEQRMKPPGPAVETVVVDVIEEPAPGVITVTEFEETHISAEPDEREEC